MGRIFTVFTLKVFFRYELYHFSLLILYKFEIRFILKNFRWRLGYWKRLFTTSASETVAPRTARYANHPYRSASVETPKYFPNSGLYNLESSKRHGRRTSFWGRFTVASTPVALGTTVSRLDVEFRLKFNIFVLQNLYFYKIIKKSSILDNVAFVIVWFSIIWHIPRIFED